MKTHPRVGGEALVSFSCTRAFALSRAIALTRPDFWDPAGLSSDGSVENFKRRRQTELKHGRIWAAGELLYSLIGITVSWGCLFHTNDACMGRKGNGSHWHLSHKYRNKLMHSIHGNNMLLFCTLMSFCFSTVPFVHLASFLCVVLCSMFFVHVLHSIRRFSADLMFRTFRSSRKCQRCRFAHRRLRAARKRKPQRFTYLSLCILGICFVSPLTHVCIRTVWLHTFSRPLPVMPHCLWHKSRKQVNRLMHSIHGNTVRTPWESSPDKQGIQLFNVDELKLPGDNSGQILRADQVCNGATGFALCNSIFLQPKLKVRGGSYLLLIIPGPIGDDLRSLITSASATLIGNTFTATLTFEDPHSKKVFPKQVTCINLGLQNVAAADLRPTVTFAEDSVILCVHAYHKHNPEGWNEIYNHNFKTLRQNVVHRICQLGKFANLDFWGLRVSQKKDQLNGFVRVSGSESTVLLDCKDVILYFRPFVSPEKPPKPENGVALLWSNKIHNAHELTTVSNTLKGVRGFIANAQGLGVRVECDSLAAARSSLQMPSTRFTQTNQHVKGDLRFVAAGFPLAVSAAAVVKCLASPAQDSPWASWHVIPYKSTIQGSTRTWYLKADQPPLLKRLVLTDGTKVTISEQQTAQEAVQEKRRSMQQQAEIGKAKRRQDILSRTAASSEPFSNTDPWSNWNSSQASKGSKGQRRQSWNSSYTRDDNLASEVAQLRDQCNSLTERLDKTDRRIDVMDHTMAANHNEVMMALRSLGASGSSGSENPEQGRKRSPEMKQSPLKQLAGGASIHKAPKK